jgi:hypothetical protein
MKYNFKQQDDMKGRLVIGVFLIVILGIISLITNKCNAQTSSHTMQPVYKYYFIETRMTNKGEVELNSEKGTRYVGIDSIVNTEWGKKDNKHFGSYSEAFNALSDAGLEFVQFYDLASIGGASKSLIGDDLRVHYALWRKRIQ